MPDAPVDGQGIPPENYGYGGISGGLMLAIFEAPVRVWAFAGVIY
jgi:hypothetical protein